jgi:hypothetical protein
VGQSLLAAKPYTVYNLRVEDDHTFFVGSAGGRTWVHNICTDLVKSPKTNGTDLFNRARDALKGRIPLSDFTSEELEMAAQNYQQVGFEQGAKSNANLARAFNFARVQFFRGQRGLLPTTARQFGDQLLGIGE